MYVTLNPLTQHLPAWLLVLFRLTGVFLYAPIFGSVLVPGRIKVMLALGLSFCVYPMLLDSGLPSATHLLPVIENGLSLWSLTGLVAAELVIGLVIGYGAGLPLIGMRWGGQVIAQQIGLGIAEVFNPGQEQSGSVGELFYLMALLAFITFGGLQLLLRTLVESFGAVPLGGFRVDHDLIQMIVGLLMTMVHLAIRVAAPLLCLVFLETIATGFIARTVPQMNLLSIGFAVRILIGVLLVSAAINAKFDVVAESMQNSLGTLVRFFSPG